MSHQTVSPGALLAGRYRIAELLAELGGARVWRAVDEVLSRAVVVDVVPADDPRTTALFDAARRAAAVADPRFLRVLDCDVHDGVTYCVREWAGGRPLQRMLGAGPLTGQQAGWLTREVSEALENLHRTGVAHGSISPATIVVTDAGAIKVAGLATEATLRLAGPGSPEQDVRNLGQVLYSSLTGRWPGPAPAWGLQPAPVEHGRLLSPRQVRAGVPRSLDDIADRLLGTPPRHHAAPITSAAGLSAALSGVIGSSHEPPAQIADETVTVARQNGSIDDATAVVPPVGRPPALDPGPPTVARSARNGPPRTGPQAPPTTQTRPVRRQSAPHGPGPNGSGPNGGGPGAPGPTVPGPGGTSPGGTGPQGGGGPNGPGRNGGRRKASPPPAPRRSGGNWGGRILILLAILALLSVIAMAQFLVKGAINKEQGTDDAKDATRTSAPPSPPAGQKVTITSAQDFDPPPKGSGDEHPKDVPNTYDGDPGTTWTTMSYKRRPDLGGTKEGVGIVYDLGSPVDVSQVTVSLVGEPTSLELRVPEDDPAESPQTVGGWKSVAEVKDAGEGPAVLKPATRTKTRYVLVWLTSLPKASKGDGYRGEISEVTVQR